MYDVGEGELAVEPAPYPSERRHPVKRVAGLTIRPNKSNKFEELEPIFRRKEVRGQTAGLRVQEMLRKKPKKKKTIKMVNASSILQAFGKVRSMRSGTESLSG